MCTTSQEDLRLSLTVLINVFVVLSSKALAAHCKLVKDTLDWLVNAVEHLPQTKLTGKVNIEVKHDSHANVARCVILLFAIRQSECSSLCCPLVAKHIRRFKVIYKSKHTHSSF